MVCGLVSKEREKEREKRGGARHSPSPTKVCLFTCLDLRCVKREALARATSHTQAEASHQGGPCGAMLGGARARPPARA